LYRDELETARARNAELEERVRALEAREKPPAPASALEKFSTWAPLSIVGAAALIAFVLAIAGHDAAAMAVSSQACVLGLVASAWSWGAARRLSWLLASCAAKIAAAHALPRFVQSMKALRMCGTIAYPEQCLGVFDLDYYVFWYAPTGVIAVSVVELFALRVMLSLARTR
jgi:hypothetical protein